MSQRRLEVVDYQPVWIQAFALEKAKLAELLKGIALEIHHIGSTAIPGLAAKPIIDILVEVKDLHELEARTPEMELLGYRAKGENGITGRRYFQKGGNYRTHHVHAFQSGDENLVRHIAFRDYLLNHRDVVVKYEQLKKALVAVCGHDLSRYQDGKSDFVREHQALALRWYHDAN